MKPYSISFMSKEQRIFNYRLSRGRRVSENAFGIMAQRWGILLTTMQHNPINVRVIVSACVCLHNLMRMKYGHLHNGCADSEDENHKIIPGSWREAGLLETIGKIKRQSIATEAAKQQRKYLTHYFNSPAASVPWQDKMM